MLLGASALSVDTLSAATVAYRRQWSSVKKSPSPWGDSFAVGLSLTTGQSATDGGTHTRQPAAARGQAHQRQRIHPNTGYDKRSGGRAGRAQE